MSDTPNSAKLEAEYSKKAAELDILCRKIAITKDEEHFSHEKAKHGDLNLVIASVSQVKQIAERNLAELQGQFECRQLQWQLQDENAKEQMAAAIDAKKLSQVIQATQTELDVTKERSTLVELKLQVLQQEENCQAANELWNSLQEASQRLKAMEDELVKLKETVLAAELQFHIEWGYWPNVGNSTGHSDKDKEIAQLKKEILQKDLALRTNQSSWEKSVEDLLPFWEAGVAIRLRKIEWTYRGNHNQVIIDWGNKAAHFGFALADAILLSSIAELKDRQEWYLSTYDFYPHVILSLRKSSKCLRMLDWRGGMVNFDCYVGGQFQNAFERCFRMSPMWKVYANCSKTIDADLVDPTIAWLENHDIAKVAYREMEQLYKFYSSKQKMERQARKRSFGRTVRTPGRRACLS